MRVQVGEPAAAAASDKPAPEIELAAELISVTFKSAVKTSHARATVQEPHWESGSEAQIEDDWSQSAKRMRLPPGPYSKRAAVYLVKGAGGGHEVEVKVKVTKSRNVSGDAKLLGTFRGLSIEGSCPTAAGEHTVTAQITDPPEEIQAYRGKIAWRLSAESPAVTVNLGSTLAEVYFILGIPTLPYRTNGVWAEALRFLCGRIGVVGVKDGRVAAAEVTAYCHSAHLLRYDTIRGGSHYGVSSHGGAFKLENYMFRLDPACNCYDQAAAIESLSGALGVALRWLYLFPFGYIRPTNLVGVGRCNNPFFQRDESKKLVASDMPGRTVFDNHAFIGSEAGNVLDACGGPHLGKQSVVQYLDASIDDTPSLYRGKRRAGCASDVVPALGVRAVR
jgi:hypothetical protein